MKKLLTIVFLVFLISGAGKSFIEYIDSMIFQPDPVSAETISQSDDIHSEEAGFFTIIDPAEKDIADFDTDTYVLGVNLEDDYDIVVLMKEDWRQGDKVKVTFGEHEYDVKYVTMMNDAEALEFMTDDSFWWNEWKDPNRGKNNYIQTEDGTWVRTSYYTE